MNVQAFLTLKNKLEQKQREIDKASGALEHLKNQIKNEFKVSCLSEAKELLQNLKQNKKELEDDFQKRFEEFSKQYNCY